MIHESRESVTLNVKVIPRAKRNEIVGVEGEALKLRLDAPPVEGKANEALVRFLADKLGIARAKVEIVRGETSRHKVVRVYGITTAALKQKLGIQVSPSPRSRGSG